MGKEGNSRDKSRSKKLKPQRKKPVNNFLNEVKWVDYKDVMFLKRFMNDKNKIVARRSTGGSARIQRLIQKAVKNAREMALLPYCTSR